MTAGSAVREPREVTFGPSFRFGTLGGALTFAGQAASAFAGRHPDLAPPSYLPTMDDVAAAVADGRLDGGLLTSETSNTACTDTFARLLRGDRLFVAAEIVVPYRCALLARPGTALGDVTTVGGHGSLRQCARFLSAHLPGADVRMHGQNSIAAAQEVLAGDGTSAVVGTEALGERFGLEILAHDIDDGSTGAWWVLTPEPVTVPGADHLAVLADGAGALGDVLAPAARLGLRPRTVTNAATGRIFAYRYLVVLATTDGAPLAHHVLDELGATGGAQLVGAFTTGG
ncbi:hypothetical protein I6A60_33560 [Frankia sp. AgB1.9]|uniref:prephenate dehydratase domain-containing protein n=1 Tax=unclassified Frankia TaxID=2632575 RepID=UPI001932E215|nr:MULTISPECIES: prephenate dehydratase domain-containing protein [unclassified Frankia]MBL7493511.1 hypothetical protein [Frankia sp. AgW1.1]MBL7552748.1 hypothetical protein [Frankia sp. AgB1.9]MBL7624655.1 hypothetical protein [Frankia sp. AgB1.8]